MGIQKLTLLDYPEKIACTVFLGGCNLRCPFCHNASLVLGTDASCDEVSEGDFFDFLESRRGRLEGVCVSGGEPTLRGELPDFIEKIKKLGYLVKLDTNGTNPEMLESLVARGLVDYVAMDIKNSKESYAKTVGIDGFDVSCIERSAAYLMRCGVDFEFRTTLVRQLHTPEDIIAIGEWLAGGERYFLQTFIDSGDLIGGGMSAYSEAETEKMAQLLRKFVPLAQIR